jgi:regulator of RNase E activity RraA
LDFPCFGRAAVHRRPYKNGRGDINVTVSIGGLIASGDIVVGDEGGVISFPRAIAAALMDAERPQEMRETEVIRSVREGRYDGIYGRVVTTSAD